jgi:spore photoproduct lyase
MGFRVRACFDPAIWLPDFEEAYGTLIKRVFQEIPAERLTDASIGTFRISQEYLKTMRKNRLDSAIVQRPYQCEGGVAGYGKRVSRQMMEVLKGQLLTFLPEERIFLWEPLE